MNRLMLRVMLMTSWWMSSVGRKWQFTSLSKGEGTRQAASGGARAFWVRLSGWLSVASGDHGQPNTECDLSVVHVLWHSCCTIRLRLIQIS